VLLSWSIGLRVLCIGHVYMDKLAMIQSNTIDYYMH
jgi:hypothetical protein